MPNLKDYLKNYTVFYVVMLILLIANISKIYLDFIAYSYIKHSYLTYLIIILIISVLPLLFFLVSKIYYKKLFQSKDFLALKKEILPQILQLTQLTHKYNPNISAPDFRQDNYITNISRNIVTMSKDNPNFYLYKYFIKPNCSSNQDAILRLSNYLERYQDVLDLYTEISAIEESLEEKITQRTQGYKLKYCCNELKIPTYNNKICYVNIPQITTVTFSYTSPIKKISTKEVIRLTYHQANALRGYVLNKYNEQVDAYNHADERSKLTPALRTKIFERDNYTCVYCGASIANGRTDELHCDHIYPISRGGKTVESNLQTLCKNCNLNKSDKWRDIDQKHYKARNNGKLPNF